MKRECILAVVLALVLTACGKPVPEDKKDYVGEWKGVGVNLALRAEGSVAYEKYEGNVQTSIRGPLQHLDDHEFEVGLPLFAARFSVSKPPHQENGEWRMTVDGVDLVRMSPIH
jgi:hypothetical protein